MFNFRYIKSDLFSININCMFLIIIILAIIDLSLQWHNSYISITEIHLSFEILFPLTWGLWEASQFLFVLGLTAYFFLDCTNFPLHLHTSSTCIAVAVTYCLNFQFSRVQLFATPWIAARQASLSITHSRSLLKLMSIESVMLSHPLSPPSPPAPSPSQHQGLF